MKINVKTLSNAATNLLGNKDIYEGKITKKEGWKEFISSLKTDYEKRPYTRFEDALAKAVAASIVNYDSALHFITSNKIRSKVSFSQKLIKEHGFYPGKKITKSIANFIYDRYTNNSYNVPTLISDISIRFGIDLKYTTVYNFIKTHIHKRKYNKTNDLKSWINAGKTKRSFMKNTIGHLDDNPGNHKSSNLYITTPGSNIRYARLWEKYSFVMKSQKDLFQAITETDLRTKSMKELSNMIDDFLESNPNFYSEEYIRKVESIIQARAKNIGVLS